MGKLQEKDKRPEHIEYYFGFYIDALNELSTCRKDNGPIPFDAIVKYCNVYGVDELDEFISIIRQMDYHILKDQETKAGNGSKGNKKNNNKSHR